MFKDKIVLRKLLFTVCAIFFVRLIYFLPVPGVGIKAIIELYENYIKTQGGGWFDLLILLHASKLRNISLFALGIIPFINACIVMQIVGFLIPGINRIFYSTKNGRKKLLQASLSVCLVLSLVHSYFISLDLEVLNQLPNLQILIFKGYFFYLAVAIAMSAAVLFLIFLSELINKFGLGNGVAVIFGSEVLVRLVFAIQQLINFYSRKNIQLWQLGIFLSVFLGFIYVVWFVTKFSKKLELFTQTKEKFYIHIQPYWAGVWPVVITEAIFSIFKISLDWLSFSVITLAILFFALFYAKIVYQPRRFYELILTHLCKTNLPPAKKLEDYLNSAVFQVLGISFVLFVFIYYLPLWLPFLLEVSFISAGVFGSFGAIILFGIGYDLFRQAEFYQKIKQNSQNNWSLVHVAFDEQEAEIMRWCLKSHGVMAEVKPSHFYWGLPIRTAASGFYLYTPSQKATEARQILERLEQAQKEKAF